MRVPIGDDGRRAIFSVDVARSDGESVCTVRQLPGGVWTGTCPDFIYRHRECKHIQKIRAKVDASDVELSGDLL